MYRELRMRRVAVFTLLAALSGGWPMAASAQYRNVAESARQERKVEKQQQKMYKKAAKQQQKSIKKYQKAQQKAAKKASHHAG
jgi:hypothetical protein